MENETNILLPKFFNALDKNKTIKIKYVKLSLKNLVNHKCKHCGIPCIGEICGWCEEEGLN